MLQATQHPECRLLLTVQPLTSSGGYKVAVAGLAVGHPDAVRLVTLGYGHWERGDISW